MLSSPQKISELSFLREKFTKDGSEDLETEGAREETMERNN
jgi:hypothetical protein